jgi:hypothetical protein
MAAPIYGPASKNTGGLGFVSPVSGVFYRACTNGVKLAQALDDLLKKQKSYDLLTSFADFRGSEKNAMDLLPAWDVRIPSEQEQAAFRESFHNDASITSNSKIGRRSRTVALIVHLLRSAETPQQEDTLRIAMAYGRLKETPSPALHGPLRSAWLQWLILQVRQAQRLAMEAIFSWIETRILMAREKDTDTLVASAMESLAKAEEICPATSSLGALSEAVVGDILDIESLIDCACADHSLCIFSLMDKLQKELKEDGFVISYALRVLVICAKYVEVLSGDAEASSALKTGNFERISLQVLFDTMMTWADRPLRAFLTYFIENMILSQHFGVAAMRFDGNKQRLRLAIEEDGLSALVSSPLQPFVGEDRLSMALLLMADCGLISVDDNGMYL